MKHSFFYRFSIQVFTFLAFVVLTFGIPSCVSPCPPVERFFVIEKMRTENYSGPVQEIFGGDSVDFSEYRIRCFYEVSYLTNITQTSPLFGVTSAFADCANPGYEGSQDGIDTLMMICNTNFNDTISKGDTLNPSLIYVYNSRNPIQLSSFILSNKEGIRQREFSLKLGQKPTNTSEAHAFTVVLKLTNGKVHTSITPSVYFK